MVALTRFAARLARHLLLIAGICATHTTIGWAASPTLVAQPGVTAPASIPELARALKNDVNLIYEYVYTNIEYSPTYGVKKGALGTLLDGRGNDFDQAALMVALLRQAGYTASYVYGQIELTPAQLTAWLGVPLGDGCAINNILSVSGGIPVTLNVTGTQVCSSPLVSADIAHVWVSATGGSLGSNTYVYDPSFKSYTTASSAINLASAMGYSQSSFVSAAEAGSTITSNSIRNLNGVVLRNQMTGFANSLIGYIRANMPTATLKDVIGGRYIQPIVQPFTPLTSLPYEKPGDVPQTWTGNIPNQYRTTLEILIGGIDQTYYSDQIYGHRLTLVYDVNSKPVLYLDGLVQGTGSANATTISYNVDFPFCFLTSGSGSSACASLGSSYTNIFSFTNIVQATPGYTYAIVNGWDFTGRGMVEFHRSLIKANRAIGGDPASEPVMGEALNMIGYSWLAQFSSADDVQDRIIGSKLVIQCAVGVAGQVTGPYLDMPGVFIGAASLTSSDTNRATTALFSDGAHSSGLEWTTLSQNVTNQHVGVVSTINLLDTANSQNVIIYDANSGNWSTIQPLLSNYASADLTSIGNYISSGYRVILPQQGNLAQYAWTGVGYFAIKTDPVSGVTQVAHLISRKQKGGFPDYYFDSTSYLGDNPTTFPDALAGTDSVLNVSEPTVPAVQVFTLEPIDLGSGAYLFDHDDLTVGSAGFPVGLTFHRSYNSNNRYVAGPLGSGWSHNFAIRAAINSDGFKGLGQDSPIDGAAAIAAAYVAQDLYSDTAKPLPKLIIATLVERWLMDQLVTNTVNVTFGSQTEQFVLLPDGTYNAQLGTSDRLSLNSGNYQLKRKDGTTLAFNAAGNIATWQDPAGTKIRFTYNTNPTPLLTSVTNGLGHTLTLSYSTRNQLTSVVDETGRGVTYAYDGVGDLVSAADPSGNVTKFSYAMANGFVTPGLLTQIFYPSWPKGVAFVTNTYDSLGRIASQANAYNGPGNNTTWNYFFAGYRSEEDDAYGTQHVLYYNPRGKVLFEIQDLAGLDRVTARLYDGLDRVSSVTQPEGGVTSFTYGTTNPWANNVASVTQTPKPGSPLSSRTTSYTYDPLYNKPTSITDPLGLVTTIAYDFTTGNLVSVVTDAGGAGHFNAMRRFTYNANGQVLTAIDPLGMLTQYAYDRFGNQVSKTVDCCGAGRVNALTIRAYDTVGNLVSVTDPNGNVATGTFDANRRPLTITAPAAPAAAGAVVTSNTYDADGHRLQVQQSVAGTVVRTTSTLYTLTGKAATTTDPNGNVTRYAYDLDDRLTGATDPVGRVTTFGYDALGRPAQVSNAAIQSAPLVQRAYTPDGLIASLTIARDNATFNVTNLAYDGLDRLSTTTYPDSSTETLGYDADGNVLTRQTRAGQTITFTYDTLNRLATKAAPFEPTVTYAYDLGGRLTGASDTSAAVTALASPSGTLGTASMSYDQLNRPLSFTFGPAPAQTTPTAGGSAFTYAYDLTNRRIAGTATDNTWWSYPTTATTVSYTANNLDQYSTVGAVTPTYDGNGNLTYDGTFTYGYDAESRLISVTQGGTTIATYAYDALGHRKAKTVGSTTTIYITDADARAVVDYDGASGAVLRWYAFGAGPNKVLSQVNVATNARATFIPDIQGSIVGSLDSSSGTITKTGYQLYGESGSTAGTFRYTGGRIDPETNGLYDFRARMYSPTLGRFLQADPVGTRGGMNLYAYVGNDPLNLLDSLGLLPDSSQGGGIVGTISGFLNTPISSGAYEIPNVPTLQSCEICVAQPLLVSPTDWAQVGTTLRPYTTGDALQAALGAATVLPFGAFGALPRAADFTTETFFRAMSAADYEALVATGALSATTETFTSPSASFAARFTGTLVQFEVNAGTTGLLADVGVRDLSGVVSSAGYGNLPVVSSGWTTSSAFFKGEGNVVNIGLGQGTALDIFNRNIVNFGAIPR